MNDLPWPVHPAAELFPLLGDGELHELADDIKRHGLHEPVWLWDDPVRGTVLLDGRNRASACQLAGVPIKTRRYTDETPWSFVLSENVRRRHLSDGQRAGMASKFEPHIAAETRAAEAKRKLEAPRNQHTANSSATVADRPQSQHKESQQKPKSKPKSRDKAAALAGASGRSVGRYKRVRRDAPDLADQVDAGVISLDRAERIIRDREAEARRIAQARQEAAAQPEPARVDIRPGDFRKVLADLADIDAIITDPPYPHEYIPLLEGLAAWADKVLKPDGVLAVLMGQTYLPEVYRLLDGHRPYRWTGCYLTPGSGYASMKARVQSNWKPLIVYGGGPRFADIIRSEGTDAYAKSNHKWGQDYGAFHTIIERLTSRGQTVCDPFTGSGTTLLAAHALGRHAIGAEVDPEAYAKAKERLNG